MPDIRVRITNMPDFGEFMDYTTGDPNGEFVLEQVHPSRYFYRGPCEYNIRADGANRWHFEFNDGSIHSTAQVQGTPNNIPTGSYGPIDGSLGNVEVLG